MKLIFKAHSAKDGLIAADLKADQGPGIGMTILGTLDFTPDEWTRFVNDKARNGLSVEIRDDEDRIVS